MATGPRLLVLTARRQDLTPEQYKHHYEEIHIPLLRRLLGDAFPLAQERHYIPRSTDGSLQSLIGSGYMAYDCITISMFADEKHLHCTVAEASDTKKKAVGE